MLGIMNVEGKRL